MIAAAVADDFSGANDCAGSFAASGFLAYSARGGYFPSPEPEVYVSSIETRFLCAVEARRKSRKAWADLAGRGRIFDFQKIDSTLRGNPGDEILGMLEASGARRIACCPAYPLHGRRILNGIVSVLGQRLDQSEYARDPLTPSRVSEPLRLFPKGLAQGLARGSVASLRQAIKKTRARVLCFDAVENADLANIARACLREGIRHFAGASGLSAALATEHRPDGKLTLPKYPADRAVLVGSVSRSSLMQLATLDDSGLAPWFSLDDLKFSRGQRSFALSSIRQRSQIQRMRGRVAQKKVADARMKQLVRQGLRLAGEAGRPLWMLTGGHCAETFYSALGLKGSWVRGMLLPGLPLLEARGRGGVIWCSTKPGGFGAHDTLLKFMQIRSQK